MAGFTVRVELHGATWEDYERLHAEMEAQDFNRAIQGDDGIVYWLPPAEYVYFGELDSRQVLALAQYAAGQTGKPYSILIAESNRWRWVGLTPVAQKNYA